MTKPQLLTVNAPPNTHTNTQIRNEKEKKSQNEEERRTVGRDKMKLI